MVIRSNRSNRPALDAGGLLTSAEVAALLGVGVSAVKRWADSGTLPCVKTSGGHRRFRRHDVDRAFSSPAAAVQDPWQEWLSALVEGADVHEALALLFRERARRGSWSAVAPFLGDLLAEIGNRWARGDMTVAEEHVASASLQRALTFAAETIAVASNAPRCLLAPAEGDEHVVGLTLVELCLREHGWRALWMGAHTRGSDIAERVRLGVDMVAVSASSLTRDRRQLRALVRTVGAACQRAGIPLVLGGTGRWPEPTPFGIRVRDWEEFRNVLLEIDRSRRVRSLHVQGQLPVRR
ncbi:MAG TPA: helix-turn-helix domain-containing protein [Vicinamibacterales bacterium]|nr:helix-turn-helix domain-containing protein [Vicinamibacterales bacterium]